MNESTSAMTTSQPSDSIPTTALPGEPVPVTATPPPLQAGWWTRRRMAERSWDEQYKPAPLWKRIFAIISLAAIAVGSGLLMAGSLAAVVAAAAIALSSIVT